MSVVIETTIGDLTIDLFTDERPVACLNFMKLCKLKYYNYNLFHTIEQGFIAQTGDPTGAGDGGSSIWGVVEGLNKRFFEGESRPKIHHANAGLLSLVGAGKHLVGSQFFFTLGENLTSLDGQHCVIGEVVEGHEVLRKLNEAIVDEHFRPYQDIRITHVVILEDPFPDPRGFREPSRSPSPSSERLKNGRIAADEDIDDTEGKSMEEIQEMLAEREAKARATILEIVGDLPDAEMAPPENVLFVCKLNPVTTDDDLEIIFSRFGKVKGCEVIRDRKTGDSLQYAFVEFEDQKSCEAAYFKMDNVLIDDRRIHVDFSQSVSKVKWYGKGRGIEGDRKSLDFSNLRQGGEHKNEGNRDDKRNNRRERYNSPARDNRKSEDRSRKESDSPSPERNRMTSNERRKAREERHREQVKQRRDYKSRSMNRSPVGRDNRERSHRYGDNRNNYNRSPNRKHNEKYIPERQRNNRYSDRRNEKYSYEMQRPGKRYNERYESERKRYDRQSPQRKRIKEYSSDESQSARSSERNRYDSRERNTSLKNAQYNKENAAKSLKKHKIEEYKKTKESRRRSTSSGSSSSDTDSSSESETSESSSSSESDSSSDRKKKKSKKTKKTKKSKKSKSKKHKK